MANIRLQFSLAALVDRAGAFANKIMRQRLAKASLIISITLFVLAGFFPSATGGLWLLFAIVALLSLPSIIFGRKQYRVLGIAVLSISLIAIVVDYQRGKRLDKMILEIHQQQTEKHESISGLGEHRGPTDATMHSD